MREWTVVVTATIHVPILARSPSDAAELAIKSTKSSIRVGHADHLDINVGKAVMVISGWDSPHPE